MNREDYPMNFNGVVFDFNGTLLFDDAFHVEAWDKISMEVCGEHLTAEIMDTRYAGFPNKEILRRLSHDTLTEEQLLSLSLRKEELYREIVRNVPGGPKLVPGAEDLFDYLKANGIPCTIASASIIQNIEFFVDIFRLDRWFPMDHIIYDDGSYENKVMMFSDAIDRMHVKERVLIFEDSLSGITCAGKVGASVVAIRKETMVPYYPKFPHIIGIVPDLVGAEAFLKTEVDEAGSEQ